MASEPTRVRRRMHWKLMHYSSILLDTLLFNRIEASLQVAGHPHKTSQVDC